MVEEVLEARNPPFTVSFASADFSLSRGLTPRFGLEFDRVHIRAKDPAVTRASLFVENLYFPISLSQAIRRKLVFSRMQASEVILDLPAVVQAAGDQEVILELWKDFSEFLQLRWRQELINTQKLLRSVSIERLLIRSPDLDGKWLALEDLSLRVSERELGGRIAGGLELSRDWLEGFSELPFSRFELSLSPETLDFWLRGQWREGLYLWQGQLDLVPWSFQTQLELKFVPMQLLWSLRGQFLDGAENRWNSQQWPDQWVSCVITAQGSLVEFLERADFQVQSCSSGGDFGSIAVEPGEISWGRSQGLSLSGLILNFTGLNKIHWQELLPLDRVQDQVPQRGQLSGSLQL